MFHLQPAMFLGLFPLFAVFEGELPRRLGGGTGGHKDARLSRGSRVRVPQAKLWAGAVPLWRTLGKEAGGALPPGLDGWASLSEEAGQRLEGGRLTGQLLRRAQSGSGVLEVGQP